VCVRWANNNTVGAAALVSCDADGGGVVRARSHGAVSRECGGGVCVPAPSSVGRFCAGGGEPKGRKKVAVDETATPPRLPEGAHTHHAEEIIGSVSRRSVRRQPMGRSSDWLPVPALGHEWSHTLTHSARRRPLALGWLAGLAAGSALCAAPPLHRRQQQQQRGTASRVREDEREGEKNIKKQKLTMAHKAKGRAFQFLI
jgi:hypothetical protein